MKKTQLFAVCTLIALFTPASSVFAIGKFNPQKDQIDKANCYTFHAKLDAGKVSEGEVFGLLSNKRDIVAIQDNMTPLELQYLGEGKGSLSFSVQGLDGNPAFLTDDNFASALRLSEKNTKQEVLINFSQIITGRNIDITFVDTSAFHERVFFYSLDGKGFLPLDISKMQDYTFKYIKISFIPRATKTAEDREIISIGEIVFRDKKHLFALKGVSTGKIDIYSDFHCTSGAVITPVGDTLSLTEASKTHDVNLLSAEERGDLYGMALEISTKKSLSLLGALGSSIPSGKTVFYTAVGCVLLLSGVLYIRKKANSACEPGITPDKFLKTGKTKNSLLNSMIEKPKSLIASITLLTSGEKKEKTLKSKKLIELFEILLSHHKENKKSFLPGELESAYKDIIANFQEHLSKKEHKKALEMVSDFIEKGGKLVINKKKGKSNTKKKGEV